MSSGKVNSKGLALLTGLIGIPSLVEKIMETFSMVKSVPETLGSDVHLSGAVETKVAVLVYGISDEPCGPNLLPEEGRTSDKTRHEVPRHQDSEESSLPNDTVKDTRSGGGKD